MKTLNTKWAAAAAVCLLAACPVVNASLTISSVVGGAPTASDVYRVNFDSLPLGNTGGTVGNLTISFVPDGLTVQGAVVNQYAAPFLSGNNGNGFGSPDQANGADTTPYITTGLGQAILAFSTSQRYLGLLWGSVDGYNTLIFENNGVEVGRLTGADVLANPVGNQLAEGTAYVNIDSTLAFNRVIATSTEYAFEFDNVAYSSEPKFTPQVPEPGTILAGALLLLPFGAGVVRRFRRK